MNAAELMRRWNARMQAIAIAETAVEEAEATYRRAMADYRRSEALTVDCSDFLALLGSPAMELRAARYVASQAARRELHAAYDRAERLHGLKNTRSGARCSIYSAHRRFRP